MNKRPLSVLLALSLLLTLAAPLRVLAAEEWTNLPAAGQLNPLYDHGSETPELPETQAEPSRVRAASDTYVSETQAAAQLRDAMVARQETVELHVYISDYWYRSAQDNWFFGRFLPMVYSPDLAVGLTDGDYLRWSWRSAFQNGSTNGYEYNITVNLRYYTTAAQEQEFLGSLEQVMEGLALEGLSGLDKYSILYDYVTGHVQYDYNGLAEWQSQAGIHKMEEIDRPYFEIYTAYAALMKGTAVCQGYATLYYAMCRWAELPVRVVSSMEHAFNIVCLKDIWYYADATYDSSSATGRDWFLLGRDSFEVDPLHEPEEEYRTAAFQARYPFSAYDYDPNTPFNDLAPGSWYYAPVRAMMERGIMNGVGGSRFDPGGSVNRAMAVTVLYRMAGEPAVSGSSGFSDVPAGAYYEKAVVWAQQAGIVNGHEDNTFRPEDPVTREQLAAMLCRYAGYCGMETPQGSLSGFPDQASVSGYAREAMAWTVGQGIINGDESGGQVLLKPQDGAQRAQLAAILYRFWEKAV